MTAGREQAPAAPPRPASSGDKPMTRRGCVLGVLAWLVVMALPLCALVLAVRGELAWRRGPFVEDRLWLVNQQQGARLSGLAYSATRLARVEGAAQSAVCARTQVYFWLWRGESEAVNYCECYAPLPNGGYDYLGACP